MQVEDLANEFQKDFPAHPDVELDTYTLRAREIAASAISNFEGELLDAALEISKAIVKFAALLERKPQA